MESRVTESAPPRAMELIRFWEDAGRERWFANDDEFDRRFRDSFLPEYEAARAGELDVWMGTAQGALALVLLLDQFPRNCFRGTLRAYETDARAREVASAAIARGDDRRVPDALAAFFYLPLSHSESLTDQDLAVDLSRRLGGEDLWYAEHHRDIIRRFGRFPHRNAILGRRSSAEEQAFLEHGAFQG